VFLSIKKSRLKVHAETGIPYEEIDARFKQIPKTTFGKREKIKLADLQKLITEANKPTPIIIPANAPKTKPLNRRHIEQIRRFHGLPIL
jgi:hypothetical protein